MWFHNLQLYRLPTPWAITAEQLREQLARGPFFSCPSSQPQSRGWSALTAQPPARLDSHERCLECHL